MVQHDSMKRHPSWHYTVSWMESPWSWKQVLCLWTLTSLGRRRHVYMWSGSSSLPDFLSLLPKTFQILKQPLVESWASGPMSQFSPNILTKWFYKYFLVLGSFKKSVFSSQSMAHFFWKDATMSKLHFKIVLCIKVSFQISLWLKYIWQRSWGIAYKH